MCLCQLNIPPRAVELGVKDVVHHATGVADLETSGLDAAHRGWADDGHVLLTGCQNELARQVLRDPLSDDGDCADLQGQDKFRPLTYRTDVIIFCYKSY